ncbi:hypothetical protein pb186bvf_002244 [Paramecium bursaria]
MTRHSFIFQLITDQDRIKNKRHLCVTLVREKNYQDLIYSIIILIHTYEKTPFQSSIYLSHHQVCSQQNYLIQDQMLIHSKGQQSFFFNLKLNLYYSLFYVEYFKQNSTFIQTYSNLSGDVIQETQLFYSDF